MSDIDKYYPFVGSSDDYKNDENTKLPTPIEIAYDFKSGQVILDEKDNVKIVEGLDAVLTWCYFVIKTVRYKYLIFSHAYGSEHSTLTGQGYTRELTETEAFRFVKEALLENPYITDVVNKGIELKGDKLYIKVLIETIYGKEIISG